MRLSDDEIKEQTKIALSLINAGLNGFDDAYGSLVEEILKTPLGPLCAIGALTAFNIRFLELISASTGLPPQEILSELGLRIHD